MTAFPQYVTGGVGVTQNVKSGCETSMAQMYGFRMTAKDGE